jgi:hypothetical protein
MRRARDLELSAQLVADQLAGRVRGEGDAQVLRDPLPDRVIGGAALRVRPRLPHLVQLRSRQGLPFAGRHLEMQQGGQPAVRVLDQPTTDRVAIPAEERRHVRAVAGLATGEEIQRVAALLLGRVPLAREALFEFVSGFMNDGNAFIHRNI